jgi:DNA-binding transcriptional MocR family regulator
MDDDGERADVLDMVLQATPHARMVCTGPDYQNPTGVTLSLPRRHHLIALSNCHSLIVLQDSPASPETACPRSHRSTRKAR